MHALVAGAAFDASHQTGWTGLIAELLIRFGDEFAADNHTAQSRKVPS